MMIKIFIYAVILVINLFSAECIDEIGVGESYIVNDDISFSKDESLLKAKFNAIDKALGSTNKSSTIIENFEILDEIVINEIGGFIKDVKILNLSTSNNVVITEISGCVLKNESEKIFSLLSNESRFFSYLLYEDDGNFKQISSSLIEEPIISSGYKPSFEEININSSFVGKQIKKREFAKILKEIDIKTGDVVFIGSINSFIKTAKGSDVGYGLKSPFWIFDGFLDYAVFTKDKILKIGKLSTTKRARTQELAQAEIIEKLSNIAADEIIDIVQEYRSNKQRFVIVEVLDLISVDDMFKIRESLQKIPFITETKILRSNKIKIKYGGNIEHLANSISKSDYLDLKSFSQSKIILKWR